MSDHLAALYGQLRNTVQADRNLDQNQPECNHPRRLARIDEWTEDDQDERFEHHTIRTVCLGCDATTGYTRTKRMKRGGRQ